VDTDRQLYQSMLQNVNQAGVAAAVPSNNLRVIDPAEASLRSDDTRTWVINLGIGTFTGLLLAVGWSVFSAKASGQMRQPGEATALLRLPELGVIPSQTARRRLPFLPRATAPEPESPGGAVELATWNQKPSLLAESFRGMRASLFGPHTDLRGPKTIVVTSPGPREGKSTVASNLAISLAEAHRRVLLIDADLRSPRMHSVFKLANDRGFSNILNEDTPIEAYPLAPVIQATEVPGLSVLTAGSAELTNLGGMFYSSRLVHLLERLRADFDHVVIDTPPLLLFSDARVLGRFSDGVLLVLRAGSTYQTNAIAARQRLADDGVPVLGAVLNDWATKTNAGAYGYYYQYQRTS
jgi:capsular exopolysaccharide synthesis family protein